MLQGKEVAAACMLVEHSWRHTGDSSAARGMGDAARRCCLGATAPPSVLEARPPHPGRTPPGALPSVAPQPPHPWSAPCVRHVDEGVCEALVAGLGAPSQAVSLCARGPGERDVRICEQGRSWAGSRGGGMGGQRWVGERLHAAPCRHRPHTESVRRAPGCRQPQREPSPAQQSPAAGRSRAAVPHQQDLRDTPILQSNAASSAALTGAAAARGGGHAQALHDHGLPQAVLHPREVARGGLRRDGDGHVTVRAGLGGWPQRVGHDAFMELPKMHLSTCRRGPAQRA